MVFLGQITYFIEKITTCKECCMKEWHQNKFLFPLLFLSSHMPPSLLSSLPYGASCWQGSLGWWGHGAWGWLPSKGSPQGMPWTGSHIRNCTNNTRASGVQLLLCKHECWLSLRTVEAIMAQNLLTALSDDKNFGEGKLLENTSKDKKINCISLCLGKDWLYYQF